MQLLSTHTCVLCAVCGEIDKAKELLPMLKRNAVKSIPSSKRAAAVQFLFLSCLFLSPLCDAPPDAEILLYFFFF
jgi:hypothetical protein